MIGFWHRNSDVRRIKKFLGRFRFVSLNATMFVEAAVEGEDTQALFILDVLDNGLIYASTGALLSVIGLFMLGMAAYNRLRADAA